MNAQDAGAVPPDDAPAGLAGLPTRWRAGGTGAHGSVLMLHSLGLDRLAFDPLRAVLDRGWRAASFDQYGHGAASMHVRFTLDDCVDAARAAIEALGPGPVHLVGHSMGGAIAALAASRAGARVASLALIASPPAGGAAYRDRGEQARRQGVEAQVAGTMARWFGPEPGPAAAAGMDYARAALRSMQAEGLACSWDALAAFPGYAGLRDALPRVLCMAAADDLSTPPEAMARIVRDCRPGAAELRELAGGGHMAPLARPADVAALLQAFWRRTSS
ncbi:Putative non-heme bromoperoxidase BpoC [Pigmentiphaga humi]|uniref:Non-heme bromoperoxidase BpoC n=2 Tax=Pigmentiphaga humi TaxID=2478468 RepID=A0A3P4AX92_9BURK|nr:Putative non-heme bromoperoxidase BpoC [Pigmentiphaga humi]